MCVCIIYGMQIPEFKVPPSPDFSSKVISIVSAAFTSGPRVYDRSASDVGCGACKLLVPRPSLMDAESVPCGLWVSGSRAPSADVSFEEHRESATSNLTWRVYVVPGSKLSMASNCASPKLFRTLYSAAQSIRHIINTVCCHWARKLTSFYSRDRSVIVQLW